MDGAWASRSVSVGRLGQAFRAGMMDNTGETPMRSPDPSPLSGLANTVRSEHPLLLAAVLVWMSVEAIGDGLLALLTLSGVKTAAASRQVTPS